jgi:hypothetical protein
MEAAFLPLNPSFDSDDVFHQSDIFFIHNEVHDAYREEQCPEMDEILKNTDTVENACVSGDKTEIIIKSHKIAENVEEKKAGEELVLNLEENGSSSTAEEAKEASSSLRDAFFDPIRPAAQIEKHDGRITRLTSQMNSVYSPEEMRCIALDELFTRMCGIIDVQKILDTPVPPCVIDRTAPSDYCSARENVLWICFLDNYEKFAEPYFQDAIFKTRSTLSTRELYFYYLTCAKSGAVGYLTKKCAYQPKWEYYEEHIMKIMGDTDFFHYIINALFNAIGEGPSSQAIRAMIAQVRMHYEYEKNTGEILVREMMGRQRDIKNLCQQYSDEIMRIKGLLDTNSKRLLVQTKHVNERNTKLRLDSSRYMLFTNVLKGRNKKK